MEAAGSDDDSQLFDEPVEVDPSGRWHRSAQVLGRGACKTVYKALDEEEGREVAWNRVHEFVTAKDERERLMAEISVLSSLKHKNIMTFYDSWLDSKSNQINFITELFTSGTLRQYRKRHRQVDSEVLKRWAWQILCGLVYLHGHTPAIIHRDLKCDNIFINGCEGVVKIGDLGLATMLRARTAPQSVLGTPEFMAPELYDEEYDDRVDTYSFGLCLLELATMEYPYSECRNAAQIYRKVSLGIKPQGLQRVADKELAAIIATCIMPRAERPRSRQLLKHPYFDSIRQEKCSVKLSLQALASGGTTSSDLAAEIAGELSAPNFSRTSSAAASTGAETATVLDPISESSASSGSDSPPPALSTSRLPPGEVASLQGQPSYAISLPITEGREFRVTGHLSEDAEMINLRLRMRQSNGNTRTVAFDFDLGEDTAASVATEMVDEMELSTDDAAAIATAIRTEVRLLTGSSTPEADLPAPISSRASLERRRLSHDEGLSFSRDFSMAPSTADVHDVCSPMSMAGLSAAGADMQSHGSSPDENWAAPQDLAPISVGLSAAGQAPQQPQHGQQHQQHSAMLSRMLSPQRRASSPARHMKRLLSQGLSEHELMEEPSLPVPALLSPPLPALPRTGSSPALPGSRAPASLAHAAHTAHAGASSQRPALPLTPPAASRPAHLDLPPHRTHAVIREQLLSAFANAPPAPPSAASGPSLSRTGSPGGPEHSPRDSGDAARAASGSQWPQPAGHAHHHSVGSQLEATASLGHEGSLHQQQEAGGGPIARARSVVDRELRRRAAADTAMMRMSNLERQTMSGLDRFSQQSKALRPGQLMRTSATT